MTVDRRRDHWSARTTDQGEFYLSHGHYPNGADTDLSSAVDSSEDVGILASQILQDLKGGPGELVVRDPDETQRARYRRAIHRLITSHQIPQGFALRHTGRDSGDLTIRLTNLRDAIQRPNRPRVSVPDTLGHVTSAVRLLGDDDRLRVTSAALERALRITQAIANECTARGWTFEPSSAGGRGFRIKGGECTFDFALTEELVDREIHDDGALQTSKYSWQRVPRKVAKVGSGRLTLLLDTPFSRRSWSDRSRWSLDDKLGAAFTELETRVAEAEEKRRRSEEDLLRRQQAWDAAIPAAEQAYITDLNRQRLQGQVNQHREAKSLRAYAKELERTADQAESKAAEAIRRWAIWALSEADRLDPLNNPLELAYIEPDDITPADIAKFMPAGMNAYHRPTT
ncbi:hypothetical protein [Mycobacterium malmoense]|uniref:hypothetical protein n=1 Tax=Mycobacterium malmoense TaxID=1780 RepID=UPI0011312991|nr:hypothetical protein [Mycobacterium malmoense]